MHQLICCACVVGITALLMMALALLELPVALCVLAGGGAFFPLWCGLAWVFYEEYRHIMSFWWVLVVWPVTWLWEV